MSAESPPKSSSKPTILHFKNNSFSPERNPPLANPKEQQLEPAPELQTPTKPLTLKQAILSRVSSAKPKQVALWQQVPNQLSAFEQFEDLKELVIQNQNPISEGYYGFQDWLKINALTFPAHDPHCAEELWKVLRIVNFGEVAIPSGLIYQVLAIVKSGIGVAEKEKELVETINRFLELNEVKSNFYSLKELNNYKPIATILREYMGAPKTSKHGTAKKGNPQVFNALFQDAKIRSQKKTFHSIIGQRESLKQCTFVPFISNYVTGGEVDRSQQRSTHSKRCTASSKKFQREPDEPLSNNRPTPIDRTIFQAKVEEIDGVKEHVKRTQCSYQQRLRIKRMIQKPTVIKHRF